jgi:hypothetical protein
LYAPLTEQEIADAERDLGIVFPAEYRDYLRQRNGDGPVARLEKTDRGWWWVGNSWHRRALLTTPFPHPDSYAEDGDPDDYALLPRAEDFADDASHEAAVASWVRERDAYEDGKTTGAIIAQENGCGFETLLVLVGPLAGTVWWDGRVTCDLIVPLSLDHPGGAQPVTLDEWLLHRSEDLLSADWGVPRRAAEQPGRLRRFIGRAWPR